MMDQPTFADLEYNSKKRKTRREIFLERMDSLVPWGRLEERIRPFYPKAGRGRQPYELFAMLRIHCVQLFYNLSDPGKGGPRFVGEAVRPPAGRDDDPELPSSEHELGDLNRHLESQGEAADSGCEHNRGAVATKNSAGDRDPEMHQTKKGNEWHFGMKVHIGADAETGVVHSVTTTPANVHDVTRRTGCYTAWGDASGSGEAGGEPGIGCGVGGIDLGGGGNSMRRLRRSAKRR